MEETMNSNMQNMSSAQVSAMGQSSTGRGVQYIGGQMPMVSGSHPGVAGRKVGASVAVEGATPLGSGVGPWGGVGFPGCGGGCFNPCFNPCAGAFPYSGFYPFPPNIIIDNRDRFPIIRPSVTANILAGQIVAGGATQQVQLSGIASSTGGGSLSGNSLLLPRIGTYLVNLNATVTRDVLSPSGIVSFSAVGGTSGTVPLTSNTVSSGDTVTMSGSTTIQVTAPNSTVSFNVANTTTGAGAVAITSGTVSAQFIA